MKLREQITADIKTAMIAKESFKRDTLKFIKSEIMNVEKREDVELDDAGVIKILRKVIKTLETVNREDEQKQIEMLSIYLPKPISEDEIKRIVESLVMKFSEKYREYKEGNKGLIGLFIGETIKEASGADPKVVGKIVRKILDES